MQPANPYDSQFALMILSVLNEQSAYGYQIGKRIAEVSRGKVTIGAGTLYGMLQKLEYQGSISSWWEKAGGRDRKWYKLTAKGKRRLERNVERWRDQTDCLWQLLYPDQALPETP